MIVDSATRETDEGNNKTIWLLVILLAPFGSLIYFFCAKAEPGVPAAAESQRALRVVLIQLFVGRALLAYCGNRGAVALQ